MLFRSLYEAAFAEARRVGAAEVLCEVNVVPPNPGSASGVRHLGFRASACRIALAHAVLLTEGSVGDRSGIGFENGWGVREREGPWRR